MGKGITQRDPGHNAPRQNAGNDRNQNMRFIIFNSYGIAFIFILLIIRLFWIQIIDGKRLSEMAQEQQTQMTKTFEDLESLWDEYDVYERVE